MSMPVAIGLVAAVAAVIAAIGLGASLLLQELFQRIARLEKTVERNFPNDGVRENSGSGDDPDTKIIYEATDVVMARLKYPDRLYRFPVLSRVVCFLTPPKIGAISKQATAVEVLRCAQRIIENPWRWCDYRIAVDRWGRSVDVRLGGHAFSTAGAFWRVVNELELTHHRRLNDDFVAALDKLLDGATAFVKQHGDARHDGGDLGHLLAVTEYEIAIRAVQSPDSEKELREKLLQAVGKSFLDPLKQAVFRL